MNPLDILPAIRPWLPCLLLIALLPAQGPALPDLALQGYSARGRAALREALANGLAAAPSTAVDAPPSRFQRSRRHPTLTKMAKAMASDAAQQQSVQTMLEQAVEAFDKATAASPEFADDMAGGVATLLFTWHTLATGTDLSSSVGERLTRQLQAAFKSAAIERLSDRDKQAVHEWAIGASTLLLAIQQMVEQAGGKDSEQKVASKAGELIADLFAAPIERLALDRDGLQLRPAPATGATLPEPVALPIGTPQTWQGYSYIAPPGWKTQVFTDGVMMQAPPTQQPGSSGVILLLAFQQAEKDLAGQAIAVAKASFAQKFNSFGGHTSNRDDLYEDMEQGFVGDGFPYVEANISARNDGGYAVGHVRAMLVQLGDQVAPVVAFDNFNLVDNPVTGKGAWSQFFYGLSFPGRKGPGDAGLRAQLVGSWLAGGGSYMMAETYNADGTYGTAMGYQTERDHGIDKVLVTTHGFFGEGRYFVNGNRLSTWPKGGKPSTHLFRVCQQRNTAVASGWIQVLRTLNKDEQGQIYEASIVKQR